MKLTGKAAAAFYNNFSGYGAVFIKTGDKEITEIEIYRDKNGNFRTMNGTLLTDRLNELSAELKAQEGEA